MIIRVLLALALTAPPVMSVEQAAPSACPVPVPPRTTCDFLEVPERRDAPGKTIQVGYAVHVPTGRQRKPDPVVYMSGGPGSASMQLTGFLSQMFPDRDVVTIEQRGSKYSKPVLGCPETAQALAGQLRQPPADVGAAAVRCRDRLEEQGIDLRGYDTKEIAADVVALRRKLGYPSWNLFGVSYSTRVMLDVAAADPEGTRSVVLDSYLPEGVAWYDDAGRNLGDSLAALGVKERFEAVVARLNRSPAQVPTVDPVRGREFTARMSGDALATIMAEGLADASLAAVAPALVDALAKGNDELLRPLADAVGEGLLSHEFGLYHAVQCQDEVPFNTYTTTSRHFTVNGDKAVCDAWQLPKSAPVNATTKAPVYVLGGQYDPTTPARTAKPAAGALANARFQEFAGFSHAVFLPSACARAKIAEFLAAPGGYQVTPCAENPGPPVRPGELLVTGAPYQISRSPWPAAPFALFALVSLVQFAAGALRGQALTAFGGLAGVAFAGLIAQSVYGLVSANETALAVGVPGIVGAYSWIAVGAVALSAAAVVQRRKWPQILASVIGAGFLVWWFIWFL